MNGGNTGQRAEPDEELDRLATEVIGACIEVHRELGPGLPESCYEKALAIELTLRGIPFERQAPREAIFKGQSVGQFKLDFYVRGRLIVELKSVESLERVHIKQVATYLKLTRHRLGLLVNFNVSLLKNGGVRRVVQSDAGD